MDSELVFTERHDGVFQEEKQLEIFKCLNLLEPHFFTKNTKHKAKWNSYFIKIYQKRKTEIVILKLDLMIEERNISSFKGLIILPIAW